MPSSSQISVFILCGLFRRPDNSGGSCFDGFKFYLTNFLQNVTINLTISINKKKILKLKNRNLKFKNCHEGERCFILGNGPSLREVDLSFLADEVVFSVNNFARVKNFKEAKTNYHLWVDEAFFEMREENKMDHEELLYNYKAIAEEAPCCFVPLVGKRYIEDNKLDKILDINYFDIFEWVKEGRRIICDLDKQITGFTTVVQYAIVIAIYMGFKEIYLLGCDSTNIIAMLNIHLFARFFNILYKIIN